MDLGGLELISYTYTKIGGCHENNYTEITQCQQAVWYSGSTRVHCQKDSRFDAQRLRMYEQTKKVLECSSPVVVAQMKTQATHSCTW